MRFVYQYRTSDNEVHFGEIVAADRDSAYRELKGRGVKPSRLDEAHGFFNKLFGKGKRWIAICLLAILFIITAWSLRVAKTEIAEANQIERATPRHQIYGDPAVVSRFDTWQGLAEIFGDNEGFIELAAYAQPGKIADMSRRPVQKLSIEDQLRSALTNSLEVASTDAREILELKQIVNGMLDELVAYLENGNGNCRTFKRRLEERAREEMLIFNRVKSELEGERDVEVWDAKNEGLRTLGLPTIPIPDGY